MTTEKIDGSEGSKWTGSWHRAKLRKEYMVPEDAANHTGLRGFIGVCQKYHESSSGMSWAYMEFNGTMIKRRWIRTCYLVPTDGSEVVHIVGPAPKKARRGIDRIEHPVTDKMARIWASVTQ